MPEEKKVKEEIAKENSNYLRGTIKEELSKDASTFSDSNTKLLKFHGIYQQDNRDSRNERSSKGLEKEYSFMVRTKLPGGELNADQYLGLDSIADKYSNKTLRLTTRQTIQFHGILKGDLHKSLNEINKSLINTYGACGDVVRNIMACPVCEIDPEYSIDLNKLAKEISTHFLPNTRAYYEIWIDEEKVDLGEKEEEPFYGKLYLPRKFKIGLTLPQDNCIDVFTQDIGIVAIDGGFNILIGGGLGHHHNKPETYPRIASEFCFITPDKLIETLEKIILIQRDYGSRTNRKHARMKYLIDDKGLDWFKAELEKRVELCHGKALQHVKSYLEPYRKIESYKTCDHLGWHKQINGNHYLGLFIENGRIIDLKEKTLRSGLKEIIEKFKPGIRLTPQQNIILTNIKESDKEKINTIVKKHGFYTKETVSSLRRNSMACPAMPTCGLALAEAERTLPNIINELEALGYKDESLVIRMSGCPNSCSRPPVAELGIIGMSADKYNVYVGGDFEGTRLNKLYKENVSGEKLVSEITSLFNTYRQNRNPEEGFGNFCNRFVTKP